MKEILLYLLFCMNVLGSYSQELYRVGEVSKGTKASYYCKAFVDGTDFVLRLRNVSVRDTTDDIYYADGRIVPVQEADDFSVTRCYKHEELVEAFKSVLTKEELTAIEKTKDKGTYFLLLLYSTDLNGEADEILCLAFRKDDPVFSRMNPDRLFLLEQKLKTVLKVVPPKKIRELKSFKCSATINYREDC